MSRKSRVFAVCQPTGTNKGRGAVGPSMDLSPAAEYGELVFVLDATANPLAGDLDTLAREALYRLVEEGFGDDDWLLLVGNPILIGLVTHAAATRCRRLNFLQWSRDHYEPARVCLELFGLVLDRAAGVA
jgi:hypothetical protein